MGCSTELGCPEEQLRGMITLNVTRNARGERYTSAVALEEHRVGLSEPWRSIGLTLWNPWWIDCHFRLHSNTSLARPEKRRLDLQLPFLHTGSHPYHQSLLSEMACFCANFCLLMSFRSEVKTGDLKYRLGPSPSGTVWLRYPRLAGFL